MACAHPGGLATVRTASGSLELLQEYSHLDGVISPVAQAIAEARPYFGADADPNVKVEIEGRLGVMDGRGLSSNVGQQTFCAVLALLETYPRWKHVTGWVESQDVYYSVDLPASACGFEKDARLQVRTSVGLDAAKSLVLVHTLKRRLRSVTMQAVALGSDATALDSYERLSAPLLARISVSVEQRLPAHLLPVAVVPDLVRIKQRKRFLLNSLGVEAPAFSVDMTIVYFGRTKSEAEQRQMAASEASYEIEVECLEPQAYLTSCEQDEAVLALSLILKLHDFIALLNPHSAVSLARARTAAER